jgi:hypothetical protein
MNDFDALSLLKRIGAEIMKDGCSMYLRESVSVIEDRLTLKDFYSDELKAEYSAVYRTVPEYNVLISEAMQNVKVKEGGLVNKDASTWKRSETNQYYWWLTSKTH